MAGIETIPIDPEAGLHLQGGDSRFAVVFSQTWQRVPQPDRESMQHHWKRTGGPLIQFVDSPPDGRDAFAGCYSSGRWLKFHKPVVAELPNSILAALIAHELAHVMIFARGQTFDGKADLENAVDDIAAGWGFPRSRIDDWLKGRPDDTRRWARQIVRMAATSGRWITIGSHEGEGGKRHGGIAVFIGEDGRIKKGPPALSGKHVSRLKDSDFEQLTRRQEISRSAQYDKAARRRQARREGLNPDDVQAVVDELQQQDREHVDELKYVLKKARERLGLSTRNKAFAGGGDSETLQRQGKAMDDVAAELQESYPHILPSDEPAQDLFELLSAGLPEYQDDATLWGRAVGILQSGGTGGSDDDELAAELRGESRRDAVPFSLGRY